MVEEEEEEAAADATAGSLKISAKKRRQVGSPLLVLSDSVLRNPSLFPFFSHLKALVNSIPDHLMKRNTYGFGQKIASLFPKSL